MSTVISRLPSVATGRTGLETRAVLLAATLLGTAVALAPVGPTLLFCGAGAAASGILLARSAGVSALGPLILGRLLLVALFALIINAAFTSGTQVRWLGIVWPVSREGLRVGGETAVRMISLILLFRGAVQSLDPMEVVAMVERALTPLRRFGVRSERPAVVVMIALQVAPTFAREARRLTLQRALRRGWPGPSAPASERKRRLRLRIRDLPAVLLPLVQLAMRRAEELAWALPAKSFGAAERTLPETRSWYAPEWLAVTGTSVFFAVALWAWRGM